MYLSTCGIYVEFSYLKKGAISVPTFEFEDLKSVLNLFKMFSFLNLLANTAAAGRSAIL